MRKLITLIGSVAVSAMAASGAWAADVATKAPTMRAAAVDAWSPWMIRGRVLGVFPDASATIDQVPGGSVSINNSVVPELDITYFFTPNFAAEVILGVTPHKIHGAGTLTGVEIGKAWLLPPTVTFQYHFTNFGAFKPYVGAGPNYTVFFNQDAAGGAVTNLDIHNSFGFAIQAGFDIMVDRHWGINVDVKKLYLRPDVSLNNGALTGNVKIDPLLVGAGVTYRF
jgi:outer membrane protein